MSYRIVVVAALLAISLGAAHAEETFINVAGVPDVGAGIFRIGVAFEAIGTGVWLAGVGIFLMGPMVGIASIIRAVRGQPKPVGGA